MADDFENVTNLDQMPDEDVRNLVRQRLNEDDEFDVESVDVSVSDGRVSVEGRVGTEEERQRVGQVLEALGASDFDNNVVVGDVARAERSEAADVARIEDAAVTDQLGESGKSTSDTAEHLQPDERSDLYGTKDLQKAIEGGRSYTPPDGPVQEGTGEGELH